MGFLIQGFRAGRRSSICGVWAAPAAGAAHTPKFLDVRPGPKIMYQKPTCTDISWTTGIALISRGSRSVLFCQVVCWRPGAPRPKNTNKRYRTKPETSGAGPLGAIPVVEPIPRPLLRKIPADGTDSKFVKFVWVRKFTQKTIFVFSRGS